MDYEEGKKYEKKDFRKLYEELVKSDWFKKAYNNKSLGECPLDFPELKESEDERIRKEIIEFISWAESRGSVRSDWHQKKCPGNWIAYLEKQKEQKPVNHNLTTFHRDVVYCAMCNKNLDEGLRYNLEIVYNVLKDIVAQTPIVCEQKEQKPVEIHIDNPNIQKVDPNVKISTSDSSASGDELLYVSNKSYRLGYQDGKREAGQKPAEWSEEDEKIISFYEADYNNQIGDMSMKDVINMRLKFKNWLVNRLKSLRPSWKPSEEQMKALYCALCEEISRTHFDALESLYNDLKKLM